MVSRMDTESSRAVEPEAAATADALSEVETIGLGGAGSSGEKKRLEDEAKAIGFDGPACCNEDGWLCAEEKPEGQWLNDAHWWQTGHRDINFGPKSM